MAFKVAYVIARFRVDGELVEREFSQDVSDEIEQGANPQDLADRLYWRECNGVDGFFDVVAGGVEDRDA